jgi:hypothetical protein
LEKERRLRKSSHEGRRQPELVECQGWVVAVLTDPLDQMLVKDEWNEDRVMTIGDSMPWTSDHR